MPINQKRAAKILAEAYLKELEDYGPFAAAGRQMLGQGVDVGQGLFKRSPGSPSAIAQRYMPELGNYPNPPGGSDAESMEMYGGTGDPEPLPQEAYGPTWGTTANQGTYTMSGLDPTNIPRYAEGNPKDFERLTGPGGDSELIRRMREVGQPFTMRAPVAPWMKEASLLDLHAMRSYKRGRQKRSK